jgi:putative redox protein
MRAVTVGWADGRLAQDIAVGELTLRADEPAEKGGDDTGPAPHELLLAALGSCVAMTLRIYAERKGWPLRDVRVTLTGRHDAGRFIIARQVTLTGELDAAQRSRLMEIAGKCPVHKTLSSPIAIESTGAP